MKIDERQKITLRMEHHLGTEEASTEGVPLDPYELKEWLSNALVMMGFDELAEAIRKAEF